MLCTLFNARLVARFVARSTTRAVLTARVLPLVAVSVALCSTAPSASAQTLKPVPADQVPAALRQGVSGAAQGTANKPTTPPQPPSPPLPPPLSVNEQRFREMQTYVKSRGAIDAVTRTDLTVLAAEIDTQLLEATSSREIILRLLPARAQIAIWLEDDAAMDSAFERLISMNPTSESAVILWAQELTASARFAKAVQLLQKREFTTRAIDAKIALGDALIGLHQFDDSQAAYNTAPGNRTPLHQQLITQGTLRTQKLREMWERELVAIGRDQQRDDLPLVEIMTPKGAIELELFEEQAPNTVGNFIEHAEAGHYDGTTFHRFLRGIGAQGGDSATASGDLGGKSTGGWTIPDETDRLDRRAPLVGRLIMAKQVPTSGAKEVPQPNSAGSQFVVLFAPLPELDGNYTVFGRVFEGLDIARDLKPDDAIVSVRVTRKRDHEYKAVHLSESATGDYRMPRTTADGGNKSATPSAPANAKPTPGGGPINLGTTPEAKPTFPKQPDPVVPK